MIPIGNELKALTSLHLRDFDGLSFPLMAVIHSKGFLLLASAILPIASDTIRYGSPDGGIHVLATDYQLSSKMESLGKSLNLQLHSYQDEKMALCTDIEGHLGYDGRYYVLDLARVYPPEAPSPETPKSIFYAQLRPSFVTNFQDFPLCSDAFSTFIDPHEREAANKNIILATKFYYDQLKVIALGTFTFLHLPN